jgi:ferredoxin
MLFFFLFLLRVAWHHQQYGGGPNGTPSVEAYCPFGGIETFYQFMTTGGFIHRIEPSAVILFVAVLALTLIASRGFCGWICPFGSIQEWIGIVGRKLFGKAYNSKSRWDPCLRSLKYVVLISIIALTWHTGALIFRSYDPFLAFFHLGLNIAEMPWAYGLLTFFLLGSLKIDRFFCRYACPLGAVLGAVGKLGLTKISLNAAECKSCKVCDRACFAHIDVSAKPYVREAECNQCLECVAACPRPEALKLTGTGWRISHPVYASMLVVGLLSFIGVSRVAGAWQTKPEKASFTKADGRLDPDAIRGWMTLQEISTGYRIPMPDLYARAGIPAKVPPTARLNTVAREWKVDFEPDTLREVVRGFVSGESAKAGAPKPQKEHGATGEQEIRGMMTLNEISLKTGVPKEFMLKRIVVSPSAVDPRRQVRDWLHHHGRTMQDIRDAVAAWRSEKR